MKDFSYMFYPGDVLRDTQFFSDSQKGCYLSVLCCHIENIRISYDLLIIIIRNLNEFDQGTFLKIFEKDDDGYYLNWVVNAIEKRSNYLNSRSNNKAGRPAKNKDLSSIYDQEDQVENKLKDDIELDTKKESYENHMVNVNVNEKEIKKEVKKDEVKSQIKKSEIVEKSELEISFDQYLEMRKKLGKEPTPYAIELAKNKIKEYSKGNVETAIKIIEQSILNSWVGIFELRENNLSYQTKQDVQKDKMNNAFNELANEYLKKL
jgi:hypothetical protein